MNKVDVEKALKLLQQDLSEQRPYKIIETPVQAPAWQPAAHRKAHLGEYSPDVDPEDWEPQDD